MTKANQFYLAAETIALTIEDQDMADSYVTLCVHAGIASVVAADTNGAAVLPGLSLDFWVL